MREPPKFVRTKQVLEFTEVNKHWQIKQSEGNESSSEVIMQIT